MEKIHTISPQYIFTNSAVRVKPASRSDTSVSGEDVNTEGAANGNETVRSKPSRVETATGFTASEAALIDKLKVRDQQVRTHEMAHLAAGGQYVTSGMSFSYQKGPDGIMYAVGGEVGIDLSSEPDPEATISKMQVVINAALAPADPSPQDRSVAAAASRMMSSARQELQQMNSEDSENSKSSETRVNGSPLYTEESVQSKGSNIDISA